MRHMTILSGIGSSHGIVAGQIHFFDNAAKPEKARKALDRAAENERFEHARAAAVGMLGELRERAAREVGGDEAMIFDTQRMILEDPDFIDAVAKLILEDGYAAEYAVQEAGHRFARVFWRMDDAYLRERGADIVDLCNGLIRQLRGLKEQELCEARGQWVIAAHRFLPSEVIRLERGRVLAIVTSGGTRDSHASILARTMGVPAVVGVGKGLFALREGEISVVDGYSGRVFIHPDERTLKAVREQCHGPRVLIPAIE